jgi:hypothetical protein
VTPAPDRAMYVCRTRELLCVPTRHSLVSVGAFLRTDGASESSGVEAGFICSGGAEDCQIGDSE